MNYFTADWHLGDNRVIDGINLLMRNNTNYGQWVIIKNNLLKRQDPIAYNILHKNYSLEGLNEVKEWRKKSHSLNSKKS